ncbi:hypothetical protein OIDMADRAFT_147069 [Oidiodendron maius Zn]|uniref:Heterokaryon incompatibility domain-containing protein n=1 Tax=Oidiodendron maius (strain Zn) TaxID=913774 RepID=A0A0C3D9M2_OIDMZ|nr:hypothetical protein OIDMADRAFT_147069 [Oidiodendron maius Zn]
MAQYQGPPLLVYETLNSSNAEIRLLTVQINEAAGNLHYQLVVCSLNDNFRPIYGALSYVWGDPTITVPITINGSVIQVTENLAKALTALSHIPETLDHLWVDELCINQSDVHEQSQQVSMMGRIYTEAKDVYAWLGPAISGSPLAMDFANQLAEDLREYARTGPAYGPSKNFAWLAAATSFVEPIRSLFETCTGCRLVVARRATDPRDKIFSILGLVNLDYPADYTAPVIRVYAGFTAQLLGELHAFSLILSMAGHLTQSPVVGGSLPSWVPDFDAVSKFDHNFMSGVKGGIVVDEIVQVSIATPITYAASQNATAEANDILDVLDISFGKFSAGSFKNLVLQRAQHPMGISLLFAVVRTILFDNISNPLARDLGMKSSIFQTYVGCFLKYVFLRPAEAASEPTSETATMEDVLDLTDRVHLLHEDIFGAIETEDMTVLQSTILRSLRKFALMSRFRTAGGYFGHAYMHVNRRGDGCQVPVVLARVEDHYELISPCFVLGFMYGEAANFVKRGERKIQEFDIR